MYKLLLVFLFTGFFATVDKPADADKVCGKWMSEERNLEVEIYRSGKSFQAKIVWFKNNDNSRTMEEWTDKHNPDPALRDRKLIGMSILRNMVYDAHSNSWEDGRIYDAEHGHEWDASAYIDKNGYLKVKGYWHLKFIGKTMTFTRVD